MNDNKKRPLLGYPPRVLHWPPHETGAKDTGQGMPPRLSQGVDSRPEYVQIQGRSDGGRLGFALGLDRQSAAPVLPRPMGAARWVAVVAAAAQRGAACRAAPRPAAPRCRGEKSIA